MWPWWKKRVEIVLASTAGDDATAALTMILRYHRRSVSIEAWEDRYGVRAQARWRC
jgi:hypothetical protein